MKNKSSYAIIFAACTSFLLMSFIPQKHTYKAEVKKIETSNLNLKTSALASNQQAFTPLVTVALAETSAAAVVAATVSVIGICDSASFKHESNDRLVYMKMQNLDK